MAPSASRSSPASSTAATRSTPAIVTRNARCSATSVSTASLAGASVPRRDLVVAERSEVSQQVVHPVERARLPPVGEPLQLELDVVERGRVEQLAQVLGAEQVAQQVAVEGQRGRTPLRERRVALVHEHRDPGEQQRLCERRRSLGVDRDQPRAA